MGENPSICWRISGDALMRAHVSPSALTATDSWVRAVAAIVPCRTPRQFGHPQFHCGNPPPAAEPNTLMNTLGSPKTSQPPGLARVSLAGGLRHGGSFSD